MAYVSLMPYKPDRRGALKQAIARDQAQLRLALSDLQLAVRERTDLRKKIAQRPYPWLAGGLLMGVLLGLRSKS